MTNPAPPPGFVLEDEQPQAGAAPPPPPGFQLEGDGQAPQADGRSFLGKVGDRVSEFATGLGNARLSQIVQGVAESAKSAATLPGDVYAGRVDPNSQQGFERTQELAQFGSPMSAGARARQVVTPAVPQIAKDAAEAGVTLTAGQRTGNPALLSREDAAFGGGLGPRAQEVAQAGRANQMDELFRARDDVGEMAGRGVASLERPADAGGIVADAVKANADAAKQGFKAKYDEAFSSQGSFKPEAFKGISGRISESLVNRAEPVIIDDVLTPAATRALNELDNIGNLKLGNIGQPAADDVVAGVNLRGVDQARRKLVAFYRSAKQNPTDARAVQNIIREFDDQIEGAVTKGLFEGDDKFLTALKEARGAYSSYQKTFKPRGSGDDVGRALQNIVERDATPEQVANYLYGQSKIGGTGLSVRMAGRLKELLGEDSPQWAAIRQGAWQRLTGVAEGKTPMGGQKAGERIYEFLNGDGRSLARQMFSDEELRAIGRHANIEKALAAKPGTTNPSNSGNRLAGMLRESFGVIGSMLGASASGPMGAGAGYAAGKAAGAFGEMRNAAQTRQLFRGVEPSPSALPGAAATTGRRLSPPATVELLQRESREDR